MATTLRSYCKINLGLAIGPVRPDGFHALTTLYQTLDAHDLVTVTVEPARAEPGAGSIRLTSNDRRVPLDGRNTVHKMLTAALGVQGRGRLAARVHVHIDKRLPIKGGLGGGSANAAAALIGLEREFARRQLGPPLTGEERLRLAAGVGSDVPLFLLGGAVLGLGRGEEVVPLADLPVTPAVIALPHVGVSTPAAFKAWDAEQTARKLTPAQMADRLGKLSRALASAWAEQHAAGVFAPKGQGLAGILLSTLVQTGILLNDFESVVFRQHPLLEQIKCALAGKPAGEIAYAALSGSGSAVFGLYPNTDGGPMAVKARSEVEARLNALGTRSLRARTLGRRDYWAGMLVDESFE